MCLHLLRYTHCGAYRGRERELIICQSIAALEAMCAVELGTANPDMSGWYEALDMQEAQEAQDISAATMRATLERSLAAVMVPSCCSLLSYPAAL